MKHIFTAGLLYLSTLSFGQVGIGTAQPNNNAILDLTSTNKGFLPPRLNTVQRDNIPGISEGLVIYNTDIKCLQYWNSSTWVGSCKTAPPPGIITGLDCSTAVITGTLEENTAASGVSATIAYSGGNGGSHSGQTVASSGVAGLVATLSPGAFANGNGMLTYTIAGTPMGSGTASFALNIGGQSCTLTVNVDATPPIPDLSKTCAPGAWRLPYSANNTSVSGTVNGIPVTATYSNYTGYVQEYPSDATFSCGVLVYKKDFSIMHTGTSSRINIKFDKEVSNIKITQASTAYTEKYTYKFKNKGVDVTPKFTFSTETTCNHRFSITNNTVEVITVTGGSTIYNVGDEWFDEIEITGSASVSTSAGSAFGFCVQSARN